MAVNPTKGTCTFAMAFQVERGRYGAVPLDSLGFVVIGSTPGAMGINPASTEPLHLDHTGHPASDRVALAHASKSHVRALGFDWHDVSGTNHGQYAPFAWGSA
jgi:hypothetical protein